MKTSFKYNFVIWVKKKALQTIMRAKCTKRNGPAVAGCQPGVSAKHYPRYHSFSLLLNVCLPLCRPRTLINTADPGPMHWVECLKGILCTEDLVCSTHSPFAVFNVTKAFLSPEHTHTHRATKGRVEEGKEAAEVAAPCACVSMSLCGEGGSNAREASCWLHLLVCERVSGGFAE